MSLLANGQYKIFSTQYPGQDADLLGGNPTALIAGYHNNTGSKNMVWNVTNIGPQGNQFTLTNAAPSAHGAHAGVSEITVGAELRGSTNPLTWTLFPTCNAGEYMIFAPSTTNSTVPSGLVWSLSGGTDGAPITLAPFSSNNPSKTLVGRAGFSGAWTIFPVH